MQLFYLFELLFSLRWWLPTIQTVHWLRSQRAEDVASLVVGHEVHLLRSKKFLTFKWSGMQRRHTPPQQGLRSLEIFHQICDLKQVMVAAFVVGIILLLLSLLSSQIGQTAVQATKIFQHWRTNPARFVWICC